MKDVFVSNLTPYAREEWGRFGAPLSFGDHPIATFPQHGFYAAKVCVPPWYVGWIQPIEVSSPGNAFKLHPRIKAASPFIVVNGEAKHLKLIQVRCDSPACIVALWSGRTQAGTFELVTYTYSGQPTIPFEAFFACESKDSQIRTINLSFGCQEAKTLVYGYKPIAENQGIPLLAHEMEDTQGASFYGSLFYGHDNDVELETCMAQAMKPLFLQASWDQWGVCGQAPVTVPSLVRRRHFERIYSTHGLHLADPFAHLGMIGPPYGRTTGDHASFGWRHHNEAIDGGSPVMFEEYVACMRDLCRPGFYFETNGDFVRADKHPSWHTWDGLTHYHPGVSPDRLGRVHATWTQMLWTGYDWQHFGYVPFVENMVLNASFMALRRLEQLTEVWLAGATLPSMIGQSSLNDPGTGREVGRMAQVFASVYLATGDRRLIDRGVARFHQVVNPRWLSHWKAGDKVKPYTIFPAGTRIYPDRDACVAWEDGLAATGIYLLALISKDPVLMTFATEIATWVAKFAYYPDGTHMLAGFATNPNNDPPDHNDLKYTWSDQGTDYKSWCRGAVEIAHEHAVKTNDTELKARCELILTKIPLQDARWGGLVAAAPVK